MSARPLRSPAASGLSWLYLLPLAQSVVIAGALMVDWDSFGVHFAQASSLRWLWSLPALTLIALGYWRWKERLKQRLGDLPLMQAMSATHASGRHVARTLALLLGLGALIVAHARPQWGQADAMIKRTGVDIVFALDLSRSMLAQDLAPSRLQVAKDEISATLGLLGGDRAGLVVFTAVSFAQSPLTTDYGALRFYLRKLKPDQMPFGGTSLGRAVTDGVELLTGIKHSAEDASAVAAGASRAEREMKRAKTQIIVLITDGEDHESDPIAAAGQAKQQGIHVVTVGLGSTTGERVPIYREDGSLAGYKKDRKGEFVYTRQDDVTLKKMADLTGGVYLPYRGEGSVSGGLIEYINQLERSELETLMRKRYKDRFGWFLVPGALLILLSMLVGERRALKPRRFVLSALVMAWALAAGSGCQDTFRKPMSAVERGNEAIAAQDFAAALGHYQEAERQIPANARLHYDLGRAHLGLGQLERAQEAFARALETEDEELRFLAMYNLATTLEQRQQLEQAYDTLRKAVEAYAQQPERAQQQVYQDAIHNLEALFARLYPPCAKLEDDQEDNDTFEQASRVEEPEVKDRTLCGLDDDWYAIPVLVGSQIEVVATFSPLRASPDPERVFLPRHEDLQLALFDATGQHALAVDQGLAQATTEQPPSTGQGAKASAQRRLMRFTVTPDMLPQGASALLLKVSAADELEFKYSLKIDAIPPCSALDDKYEPNAQPEQAGAMKAPGTEALHLCASDEDWYSVELELGDTLFVDVQPSEDVELKRPPSLELTLFDASGKRALAQGRPESGLVTAGLWEITRPGRYLIRVRGADAEQQGPYTMQTYVYAPCPLGDDRYEDNDDSSSAAMLDPQAPMHRYLRLCPEDADYFRLPLTQEVDPSAVKSPSDAKRPGQGSPAQAPKDQDSAPKTYKLALGLSLVLPPGAPALPEDPAQPPLSLSLLSPNGDQILAEGVAPTPQPASPSQPPLKAKGRGSKDKPQPQIDSSKEQAIALDRVLQADKLPQAQALIQVRGPATFYHLIQLNPQSGQQDSSQEKPKPEPQDPQDKRDPQDPQEDAQDEPKEDGQEDGQQGQDQDPQEQEGQDPQGDDPSEDGQQPQEQPEPGQDPRDDAKPEDKDKAKPDPAQPEGQQPQDASRQGQRDAREGEKDPELQRIQDLLRALEEGDDNFQMKKALQNMPGRYIEKDW